MKRFKSRTDEELEPSEELKEQIEYIRKGKYDDLWPGIQVGHNPHVPLNTPERSYDPYGDTQEIPGRVIKSVRREISRYMGRNVSRSIPDYDIERLIREAPDCPLCMVSRETLITLGGFDEDDFDY